MDAVGGDPDRSRARAVGEHHRHARAQVGQARRRPVAHQRLELAQRTTQLVDRQLLDRAQSVLVELALEAGEVAIGLAMALVGVQHLAELGAHGADGVDARLQGADRRLGADLLGFARRRTDAPGAGAALVRGPPEEERPRERQRHGVNGLQQAGQREWTCGEVDRPGYRHIDRRPRGSSLVTLGYVDPVKSAAGAMTGGGSSERGDGAGSGAPAPTPRQRRGTCCTCPGRAGASRACRRRS